MAPIQTLARPRQSMRSAPLLSPFPARTPTSEAIKAADHRQQALVLENLGPANWSHTQAFAWLHHFQNAATAQAFADDPAACARGYL